jgi:hypothetical protein
MLFEVILTIYKPSLASRTQNLLDPRMGLFIYENGRLFVLLVCQVEISQTTAPLAMLLVSLESSQ